MPAGYDAEVAGLFRDLRAASNLTETDLAARIAAPIGVVQALEQGALYALPPWPETCRVVNAYGTLLNLDTRPLLRRIYAQLEAGIVELKPKAMPDVPVMAPQGGGGDFRFGAGNAGRAPRPQAMPQAPAWPNGQQTPPQPQAPWPAPQQAPQAPWPNGAENVPQPQAWPAQPRPVPPPPPAYQQPPQGFPPDPQGFQPDPHGFQPDPHGFQPDPQGFQPEYAAPLPVDDAFMGEPEPAKARKKPGLLKWGLGALIASVVLVGLWMALGDSSDPGAAPGGSNASDPVLDADDPRSRKADRLPSKF